MGTGGVGLGPHVHAAQKALLPDEPFPQPSRFKMTFVVSIMHFNDSEARI